MIKHKLKDVLKLAFPNYIIIQVEAQGVEKIFGYKVHKGCISIDEGEVNFLELSRT